jgi:hypothetical protein
MTNTRLLQKLLTSLIIGATMVLNDDDNESVCTVTQLVRLLFRRFDGI